MGRRSGLKPLNRLLITIVTLCVSVLTASCAGGGATVPTVTLIPSPQEVKPGEQFAIEVQVEPVEHGISAVEIDLSFGPEAMQVIQVQPGTLLGERPLSGILNIDNEAGTLSYSLARIGETEAPTEAATFAEITFRVLQWAEAGSYELDLSSAGFADEEFEDIPDIELKGTSIKISP